MALENLCSVPFGREQVAIAVCHSHFGSGHVGLGFHSAKSGPQVLHLAWHLRLEVHDIPAGLKTCWAAFAIAIPPMASKQVVALVRAVARRGASISYGLDFLAARGSFSANGNYKAPKGSDGLTCASFVVEVLRAAMVSLVNLPTWRSDPLNVAWGNKVCSQLVAQGADHIEAVQKNVTGLRLTPFEVAGAAQLGAAAWPAEFDQVQAPAAEIERQFKARLIKPPGPAIAALKPEQ